MTRGLLVMHAEFLTLKYAARAFATVYFLRGECALAKQHFLPVDFHSLSRTTAVFWKWYYVVTRGGIFMQRAALQWLYVTHN